MSFLYRSATRKRIAAFLLCLILSEIGFPSVSYALTGGPSQPEFSSFEPVSTNQMVDEFTGDFTYNLPVINIPGPQGSDYPLSLSYHSGATPEEEASWVGYGWSLNPGAITRNTRGFPDDFKESSVHYWNKSPREWTATRGVGTSVEAFGKDFANVNASIRYNNYQGFGYSVGAGIPIAKGVVSLGYNLSNGRGSFSLEVSPAAILKRYATAHEEASKRTDDSDNSFKKKLKDSLGKSVRKSSTINSVSLIGGNFGMFSFSEAVRSNHVTGYSGASYNVTTGLTVDPIIIPSGFSANMSGSYSWQENTKDEYAPAFGYMYSNAALTESAVTDYTLEKDSPYTKRDVFLGIPFNSADNFGVSGEGVGGGFRLYHEDVGEFVPNTKSSTTKIFNVSPEVNLGTTFGLGVDVGAGWQTFTEGQWQKPNAREKFSGLSEDAPANTTPSSTNREGISFRFANDLGGSWSATDTDSDEPVTASINSSLLSHSLNKDQLNKELHYPDRASRSGYIGYHTFADLYGTPATTLRRSRAFSQRTDLPITPAGVNGSMLCEMSIATATGANYIYGLPLLSRKERNLQFGVQGESLPNDKYLVYSNKGEDAFKVKVGEERPAAYANSFLLTEVHTPDYVDRRMDGPSPDDFGGYTRFNYTKYYGSGKPSWYNWRIPYKGLLYQKNSLSDPLDDMGTVSSGEKEIAYLQSVQTKTHTAIFTTRDRIDGLDAEDEATAKTQTAASSASKHALQALERIDLYANTDIILDPATGKCTAKTGAKPIKTVHFDYAATGLSTGLPNATNGAGKLTLTRIWFEFQNIPTKISPYTFSYAYPDFTKYPEKYKQGKDEIISGFYRNSSPQLAQNPIYSNFNLDAWGNYQADGQTRSQRMQPWLDQKDPEPTSTFDPAAWQLKVITLPTGGQIHIQYEQDDYAYVQDKPAHAMVALQAGEISPVGKFFLDLASIGVAGTDAEQLRATARALKREYPDNGGRKIYFKFLYDLANGTLPDFNSCNADFISGYVTVKRTGLEGNRLFIEVDGSNDKYTLPRQVCKDFLQTQRAGKLVPGGSCNPNANRLDDGDQDAVKIVRQMAEWQKTIWTPASQCASLNPAYSYFRIPLAKPKKGGGLRVKRLLTYDAGFDGKPVLYGSEFIYRMEENGQVISSGVATTEPGGMREENILVDYLPRQSQGVLSKIIAGIDRKQTEGPLGESLLPAPSVGYARVVTRNIHSGRTSTGYSVSEFATARSYPMQVRKTVLQSVLEERNVYAVWLNDLVNNAWAAQGFSFILNSMHGQVLRKATYPGDYHGLAGESKLSPISQQRYSYFEPTKFASNGSTTPAEDMTVQSEPGEVLESMHPGREVDITSAQKAVTDNMVDLSFEADLTFSWAFVPLTFNTYFPTLTHTQAEFYTHVTSKVVRYPAVVKRVETLQDGIVHTSVNMAFDKFTGQAVVVKSTDEFEGGYLQASVMASWLYPELQPKFGNENLVIKSTSGMSIARGDDNEIWLQFTGGVCDNLGRLTKGDQLELNSNTNFVCFTGAPDFIHNRIRLYPAGLPHTNSAASGFTTAFLQSATTAPITRVQIVRSGHRNQLSTPAGATTYHQTNYESLWLPNSPAKHADGSEHSFTDDLNTWLASTAGTGTSTVSTTLPGSSYAGVNMTAYAAKLPPSCVPDPANATISQVQVARQITNGQMRLTIKSFQARCANGSWVLVKN
ncbi:hypothetical protein [Hymenobacter lucidus]|uniref:PA14 domain-containing protein n=1 Tax=Hymenobacter lucidus TaxID=2880930 RepID=A0ABS8AZB1_9BACT|nr:hypothetical protein [Hymenobacter lucidus]MCB2411146.1 hypothetical protein [Hymenobacter lucidus]